MSPFFQRPLELGADIVVHSTTKFLNGHSDSVGGVAVVKTEDARGLAAVRARTRPARSSRPSTPGWCCAAPRRWPCACPATRRTGRAWPQFLRGADQGPEGPLAGLPRPSRATRSRSARPRLRRADLVRPRAAARPPTGCLRAVRLCSLGESLGGVETLISHPATMTHAGYTQAERDALGIGDGLVRISVGCEDAEDLMADLGRVSTRSSPASRGRSRFFSERSVLTISRAISVAGQVAFTSRPGASNHSGRSRDAALVQPGRGRAPWPPVTGRAITSGTS